MDTLQENEAMIFPYETPMNLSFWMKDMKFPLDLLWLDDDKRVVHVEENLQPCSPFLPCHSYSPNVLSQYVLGIVADLSSKYGITTGTQVDFDLPPIAYNQQVSANKNDLAEVILNGTDIEGNGLKFSILDWPDRGELLFSDMQSDTMKATYVPSQINVNSDSFTYKVNDGASDSNIGKVLITFSP